MVLDRVSTASLFAILASIYPHHAIYFYVLLGLDLGSHWLQVTTTYSKGNNSHKGDDPDENFFVKIYYKSKAVLTLTCACAEYCGCALYCLGNKETMWLFDFHIINILFYISLIGFVYKQFINIIQIKTSSQRLVDADMDQPQEGNTRKAL